MITRATLTIGGLILLLAVSGILLAAGPPDSRVILDPTGTVAPAPTVPPIGPYRGYAPFIVDTVSLPTAIPSPTSTISPDATPTIYISATPPTPPTDFPVTGTATPTIRMTATTPPDD